jgi:hypothetical protein
MRNSLVSVLVVLSVLLTGGCFNRRVRTETAFMKQHTPTAFFQALAEKKGRTCTQWSGGGSEGSLPCSKRVHIEIVGRLAECNDVMIAYLEHIRQAIVASGASLHGEHKLGDDCSISSFEFKYTDDTVVGFIYATSVVNHRGNLAIFVVMYEH